RQLVVVETVDVEAEFRGERSIERDQPRLTDRYGAQARVEVLGQARVAARERNAAGAHASRSAQPDFESALSARLYCSKNRVIVNPSKARTRATTGPDGE